MKKTIAILLAVLLLFCAACQSAPAGSSSSESVTSEEVFSVPEVTVENPVAYFSMSMMFEDGTYYLLDAYEDGAGGVYVDYTGEDMKKVGTLPTSVLHSLAAVVEDTELPAMNGEDVYEEGSEYASAYIAYADESYISASYSGKIPEKFKACYETMAACFRQMTAELPVYVPQPMVMGEVNEDALNAILEIISLGGVEAPDSLSIADVPMDEFFAMSMGLSASEGIVNGTMCAPLMMPNAYSLAVATVADAGSIAAVRQDFEDNLDWNKWVCVGASDAVIAEKGNMVLCLMGTGAPLYEQTVAGIEAAGWTNLRTLENKG